MYIFSSLHHIPHDHDTHVLTTRILYFLPRATMTRQLRPRKSQPKYAILAGIESDEEHPAGPSTVPQVRGVSGSGSESDFTPSKECDIPDTTKEIEEEDEDAEGELDNLDDAIGEELVIPPPVLKKKLLSEKGRGKAKAKAQSPAKLIVGPRGSKRQNYVLPTPSVHHRHRAVPLYSRTGRVERLTAPPVLFNPPSLSLTNGYTESSKVSDRVNKAWGFNVGPGPLWDMSEDRGWYKEASITGGDIDSDGQRRPRVYSNVHVRNGWRVLSPQ